MMRRAFAAVLLFVMVGSSFAALATSQDRENSLMTRMFGFQYPLDSGSGYKVGWITNFDENVIEEDFQAIRGDFSQVNLLRIPIGWKDMNNPILLTQMDTLINLGKRYGFKFMFVLMDRVSGWWDTGPDPQNLLPVHYADQEYRINFVVSRYKYESQIYAWALSNELNVFQEVVYKWYRHFIPKLKQWDSDTPVCTSFYPLGPNATSVSRAASLVELGLDFIEFHYYPTNETNISSDVDQLTAYINRPIFLSEFNVDGGLNHYSRATNIQILNNTIQEFQKRPNVIGISYYRWSDDNDAFTIWNSTSQAPRPEAASLDISSSFLQRWPYVCLQSIASNSTEEHEIFDPSFESETEWPNISGWSKWNNHTAYDLQNITSTNRQISAIKKVQLSNYDFESGFEGWDNEFHGTGGSNIDPSIAYSMNKSLKLWADSGGEYQKQHAEINVTADHAYLLEGYVSITSATGGSAFIQLAFRNSTGNWTHWPQSEYYTDTTDWVLIHAAGIAPSDAVDVRVNCRVDGNNGSITTYFDYLTLYEVDPATYDGKSFMIAFGECTEPTWNALQVSQNLTFPNPSEDVKKIWTFNASLATVFSAEYDTDWKGALIELAFTTESSSEWITWYIGEYLSSDNNWINVSVSGIPPSNAKGLQMIIKIVNCHYGVMFVDNASLTSTAAVTPKEWIIPVLTQENQRYQVSLTISAINGTHYNGTFVSPGSFAIVDANITWFKGKDFGSVLNGTSETILFTFESGPIEVWMPIMLILGIIGSVLLIAILIVAVKRKKRTPAA